MRQKVTTIRDVARQAGVSITTVSHVLNGNAEHVSEAVRLRVLEAMEALQYRPNAIARSMVKRRTATIGVIFNEIENALFVPVIDGMNQVFQAAGYHIVLMSAPDVQSEVEAVETLLARQVDGLIFMALSLSFPIEHMVRLHERGFPFVVINRAVESSDIYQILMDDRGAGYAATRHLLALGHTRIGTISGPLTSQPPRRSSLERQRGWEEALHEQGSEIQKEWIEDGNYTYKGGYQAIQRLLARLQEQGLERPGALFIASDVMALGAIKALYEIGLRVPEDIAIVTVGDPPFASYVTPALTTLALPMPEAGREAARVLLNWFQDGPPGPVQPTMLRFQLIVRESCGASRKNAQD